MHGEEANLFTRKSEGDIRTVVQASPGDVKVGDIGVLGYDEALPDRKAGAKDSIVVFDEELILSGVEHLPRRFQILHFLKGDHIGVEELCVAGKTLKIRVLSRIGTFAEAVPQMLDIPGGDLEGLGADWRKEQQRGGDGSDKVQVTPPRRLIALLSSVVHYDSGPISIVSFTTSFFSSDES